MRQPLASEAVSELIAGAGKATRAAPEAVACANHPERATMVRCSSCDKPICPDCMVYAAVGIKCAECARMPVSARVTLKAGRMARAIAAGIAAGTALGVAYYYLLLGFRFFFLGWFLAAGIGYLVGEVVIRASGYYHGRKTALIAVACTLWAFVVVTLVASRLVPGVFLDTLVATFFSSRGLLTWVMMGVASFFAWRRTR